MDVTTSVEMDAEMAEVLSGLLSYYSAVAVMVDSVADSVVVAEMAEMVDATRLLLSYYFFAAAEMAVSANTYK